MWWPFFRVPWWWWWLSVFIVQCPNAIKKKRWCWWWPAPYPLSSSSTPNVRFFTNFLRHVFFAGGGGGVVLLPPLPLQMFVSSLLVTLLLVSGASLLACPFSCTLSASVHWLLAHFDRRSIARFLDINPYDCASQFIFVSAFMGSLSAAPSSCP